jgi:hypothetical protein
VINTPGPQNSHSSLIEIESGSGSEVTDWIVDGLEVASSPHHGIDIRITNRITIRNCYAHHAAPGDGIFLAFASHPRAREQRGVVQRRARDLPQQQRGLPDHPRQPLTSQHRGRHPAERRTTARSAVRDHRADGIISFALLENNVIYENGVNGGSAINADGVDDSVIRNNLIYDNHAFGISLFSTDGSHGSSRNKVYNNTIVQAINGRWACNIPKSKGSGGSPVGTS